MLRVPAEGESQLVFRPAQTTCDRHRYSEFGWRTRVAHCTNCKLISKELTEESPPSNRNRQAVQTSVQRSAAAITETQPDIDSLDLHTRGMQHGRGVGKREPPQVRSVEQPALALRKASAQEDRGYRRDVANIGQTHNDTPAGSQHGAGFRETPCRVRKVFKHICHHNAVEFLTIEGLHPRITVQVLDNHAIKYQGSLLRIRAVRLDAPHMAPRLHCAKVPPQRAVGATQIQNGDCVRRYELCNVLADGRVCSVLQQIRFHLAFKACAAQQAREAL